MGCRPIILKNVTPEIFSCMKKKLQGAGVHVPPGKRGKLSGRGVSAEYEWDGELKLTITVTKKPFIASCGEVERKIQKFVKQCQKP